MKAHIYKMLMNYFFLRIGNLSKSTSKVFITNNYFQHVLILYRLISQYIVQKIRET